MPCAHNSHVGIRSVVEGSRVRAQNAEHGVTLLCVSFGRKLGCERGLAGATLQLTQAALECGGQVWIAELCDCDYVVACSGAESVLLQHELRVLGAGGCLSEVSGGGGRERGVAEPKRCVMRCWGGWREGSGWRWSGQDSGQLPLRTA